jgi:hypothetical protein
MPYSSDTAFPQPGRIFGKALKSGIKLMNRNLPGELSRSPIDHQIF